MFDPNGHPKVYREKPKRPQPGTKTYRYLRNEREISVKEIIIPKEEHTDWSFNINQSALKTAETTPFTTTATSPPPQTRFQAHNRRGSLDLHCQIGYYLETSSEDGELVTPRRVQKRSALGLRGLCWCTRLFATVCLFPTEVQLTGSWSYWET